VGLESGVSRADESPQALVGCEVMNAYQLIIKSEFEAHPGQCVTRVVVTEDEEIVVRGCPS
jgi:hypothetical protein